MNDFEKEERNKNVGWLQMFLIPMIILVAETIYRGLLSICHIYRTIH